MKKYLFMLFSILSFNGSAEQLIFCHDDGIMESATKLIDALTSKKTNDEEVKMHSGWALNFNEEKNLLSCQATLQTINKNTKTIEEKLVYFDVQQYDKNDYKIILK